MIDKGQWWEFGQDTGVTPLLFTRSVMGFLMTTESGPRFNVSSERWIPQVTAIPGFQTEMATKKQNLPTAALNV